MSCILLCDSFSQTISLFYIESIQKEWKNNLQNKTHLFNPTAKAALALVGA